MIGRIKVSAVVVLYKKQMLADSKTLASLEPYIGLLHNITIVNNGPDVLLEDESIYYKSENVAIIEHLKNRPLSSIYNDFIRTNDCDRFIILDDDTT
ncbi:glycosyltransferase family 2 protein, partial [Raoultella planticola]